MCAIEISGSQLLNLTQSLIFEMNPSLKCVLCFCVLQGRGRDRSRDEAVAEGAERGTQLLSAGHVSAAAAEIHRLGEVHHESGK